MLACNKFTVGLLHIEARTFHGVEVLDTSYCAGIKMEVLVFTKNTGGHTCSSSVAVCETVKVSDARYQTIREGTYRKYSTCNGRVSYVQRGSGITNYLFFLDASMGWQGWMVGTRHCYDRGGIAVQEDVESPDKAKKVWEEVFDRFWVKSPNLKVTCSSSGMIDTVGTTTTKTSPASDSDRKM